MVTGVVKPIAPKPGLDALGYDPEARVLYGVENSPVDGGAPNVVTIDPEDGSTKASEALPQDVYTAGAVSRDGLFYVRGRNTVQVVDVKDKARVVRSFEVSEDLKLDDFAVRPKDGQIWGVDNAHGDLVRIDPRTGSVKRFGRLGVGRVTAAFFDGDGVFRVAGSRTASVDVAGLRSGARKVDVRRVGVFPARPPKLLDGAGCLKGVPRLANDVAAPQVAPAPEPAEDLRVASTLKRDGAQKPKRDGAPRSDGALKRGRASKRAASEKPVGHVGGVAYRPVRERDPIRAR